MLLKTEKETFFIQFRAAEFRPETVDLCFTSRKHSKCHPGFPMPD